jgi:uncharacterized protein (TIGR00730 family)
VYVVRRLCVYCGSSAGTSPAYQAAATGFGRLLAARGIGLVYGGGCVGLMGAVADGALGGGGEVIGVIPRFLQDREVDHRGLTELHVVATMHERKAMMAGLADAFVALPGGVGTLEEMFEMWTWTQLGSHAKPVGLLDVAGFYRPLVAFVDHLVAEGFVWTEHRRILHVSSSGEELLQQMADWKPIAAGKWMKTSET